MSWTTSSDRLTLLLYATFKYHIPIHDRSWRPHQWKQTDNGSFSIISLTECQEALSEGQFGKQTRDTYFVWSWRLRKKCGIGDFSEVFYFWGDIFLDN